MANFKKVSYTSVNCYHITAQVFDCITLTDLQSDFVGQLHIEWRKSVDL